MITLKIEKAICPACDVKTQIERFVGNFFVENKYGTKAGVG